MKDEQQLGLTNDYRLSLLFAVWLCFIILFGSITTVSADMINTGHSNYDFTLNRSDDNSNVQQNAVRGTVEDASTGETLIGVTIMVKGTTLGVQTDINGRFSIQIPETEAVLIFSYIGYTSQEVTVKQGYAINVSLEPEVTQLDEVVVVGYGIQKKESVVGAISQVEGADLVRSGVPSVTNAIAGKLSGVLTMQTTGQPGSAMSEIVIRGLSSWNSSTPLVLIDGVERDFKDMDPNEINTISVLKDASATAVFGAKGANGVILVTTKRGALGKPKLSFTGSYGMERPTKYPEHVDSYNTMSIMNVGLKNTQIYREITPDHILEEYRNPSSPLKALQYPDIDWFREVAKPFAPSATANLSLRGGTKFIKYYSMLGFSHQGSFFDGKKDGYLNSNYYFNRFNYRSNLDFTLTNTTTMSINLGGETGIKNSPRRTLWLDLYATGSSRYPVYFPSWVLDQVSDTDYPDASGSRFAGSLGDYYQNPYNTLKNGDFRRFLDSKLFTDLIINQKLDFLIKGLSFNGRASLSTFYQTLSLQSNYVEPTYELYYDKIGGTGNPWFRTNQTPEVYKNDPVSVNIGGMQNGFYKDLYYEMGLNYDNTFGNHSVTALALINRQKKEYEVEFPYYNQGIVARVTYDYSHKYLMEVNMGYTGSERFAPGNRYGFFPSGAIGWVISEENFFKNSVPWMNKLKLRYSDGLVGSDYAVNRWLYISDYYKDSAGNIQEDRGPNTFAQWEEAHKRDIGLEIGLFENLFHFSVDLFDEQRDKMLLSPQTVTLLVGQNFKDLNLGKVKKHGIELELEFNKTTASNLNYYVKGILGLSENRVVYKDDLPYAPDYTKAAGKPLAAMLEGATLIGTGYYTTVDDIHNNTSPLGVTRVTIGDVKYLDYNADGVLTNKDEHPIKGNAYPPIVYSFSGGFSYKNFDLNLLFTGNHGKYVKMQVKDIARRFEQEFTLGNWRLQSHHLDYWRPDNQDAGYPTIHYYGTNSTNATQIFDYGYIPNIFWRNANYLRLKEVYLGYKFGSGYLDRIVGVSKIHVYATAYNLLTFTKFKKGDPESSAYDGGFYPQMNSVNFGVKFDF